MSQTPVPFGQAIVSRSGFEREEFNADRLLFKHKLSRPTDLLSFYVFEASIGKDQFEDDCGFEWTVWLDENQEVERNEVLLLGTAEIHGSSIYFSLPTSEEETR